MGIRLDENPEVVMIFDRPLYFKGVNFYPKIREFI